MISRVSSSLLALVFWFSSTVFAATVGLDQIIAVVNDDAITYSEYATRYRTQQLQKNEDVGQIPEKIDFNVLRLLVDERIQLQAALQRGVSISQEELNGVISAMAAQNGLQPEQLIRELEAKGIRPTDFIRGIEEQTMIRRMIDITVNSRVTVSEQEIDYHLQSHKELYPSNTSYEVSHLFISTSGKSESEIQSDLENINHIHQGLLQGQPFDKAVKDFSDGEKKNEGGYLGWRKEEQLPELFLRELRETAIGATTGVVRSDNGFHILKLHDKEGDEKLVNQQLIRHILIQPLRRNISSQGAITLLNDIAEQIRNGGDFEKFARLNSDDDTSASNGGSVGWVNPGDTSPSFEKAALKLQLNEISDPVQSDYGYHIIEVLDRRTRDITQDLARENARLMVFQRKAEELYRNWLDRLRDSAYIDYTLDN
jgi:peptidyl-prolyl cis-trans isomerase SurA